MNTEVKTISPQPLMTLDPSIIHNLVISGDLSQLGPAQKVAFYNYRCQQAGLDPAAKPFDLLTLNGKQILYANAGCTQQLKSVHGLSSEIIKTDLIDDVFCVFSRIKGPDGRFTDQMGAVSVAGLKGEAKANAHMKAYTKADRRGVLSHCGLGMLDETETATIPGAVSSTIDLELASGLPEWSDEDRANAKALVEGLGQTLMDAGLTEEAIKVILDPMKSRQMSSLGDPEAPFEKWANRWVKWSSDQIKKHTLEPEAKP